MADATPEATEFRNGMPFFGGSDWLDFLNTRLVNGGEATDFFEGGDGLRGWVASAGLGAAASGAEDPAAVRSFRETLRSAVDPLRTGQAAPASVLAAVNDKLAPVSLRHSLTQGERGVELRRELETGASGVAGAIALDFARFVCDHEPERLKRCANPACTMIFYDRGKNNARRWCTMSICGNRDKVARFRARKAQR
jgi:predicted RNA-binding Zn ribbon-like protein